MSLVLPGATSGSITIDAPAVAGTTTLTLPTTTGTLALTGAPVVSSQLPAGTVLQVVDSTYNTQTTTTSGTPVATGWTVSITPKFSTSKILLISREAVRVTASNHFGALEWRRGATTLLATPQEYEWGSSNGADVRGSMSHVLLDSPGTTSAVTYTAYIRAHVITGSTFYLCPNAFYSSVCLMEVAA